MEPSPLEPRPAEPRPSEHAEVAGLIAIMDRLRSPGGCPWDAEQTHQSLAEYLVEETYEVLEAIETDDRAALREELGDLLLQIVFHSRLAQEDPDRPWGIDEVAAGISEKLIRRHPHVFGDETADSAAHVEANWQARKAAEKNRTSVTEGVPLAMPALTLARKLHRRAENGGIRVDATSPAAADAARTALGTSAGLGELLLALVIEGERSGLDAEAELRTAVREYRDRILDAESAGSTAAGR